jgi:hypothetical protein
MVLGVVLGVSAPGLSAKPVKKAAPAKPKPPPPAPTPTAPTTIIDETAGSTTATEEKKKPAKKPRVELVVCAIEDLAELESPALLKLLKKCRSAKGKESASELSSDDMLVAVCVHKGEDGDEAMESKACGLKSTVSVEGGSSLSLGADGDLALALRATKIVKELSPANGTKLEWVATQATDEGEPKTTHTELMFRSGSEGYGHGRVIWFPLPMLTTDFSSSPQGYRLGITPVAVAAGWKFYPSTASSAYFGVSAFLAWNLLVPNDTQTLSNGTFVRVNYKAIGLGALFDASGYFAIGLGLGKTFTTDNRTDFRTWIYFGPKLLFGLNEF